MPTLWDFSSTHYKSYCNGCQHENGIAFFGGHSTWPQSRPPPEEVDAELQLMDALAKLEENKWPDDGEVEILIPSEEEFIG